MTRTPPPALPDLPDDVRALLRAAEPGAPPPPPGAELAVLAKVTATVALPVAAAATTSTTATAATVGAFATLAKPLAVLVATGVIGGGALIAVTRDATLPPPRPEVTLAATSAATPAYAVHATPPNVTPPAEVEAPRDAGPRSDPRAEGELVEAARDALARGDHRLALALLQRHAHDWPQGQLREERRALTVVAFGLGGDVVRAQAAARAFEREHPDSLFIEMVRNATTETP